MLKASKSKRSARFVAATLSAALLLSSLAVANVSFVNAAEGDPLYTSDYSSKKEAVDAGLELNEKIAEEGMILVKNEANALPVKTGTAGAKVTVLGFAGVSPNAGASANGGDSSAGSAIALENIYGSLEKAGYKLNPSVKKAYEDWLALKDGEGKALLVVGVLHQVEEDERLRVIRVETLVVGGIVVLEKYHRILPAHKVLVRGELVLAEYMGRKTVGLG